MKTLALVLSLFCLSVGVNAYEIHGSSDTGFVLKCKDGKTNHSTYPPNHVTATAFCKDHGGIAAGYPKPASGNAAVGRLQPAVPANQGGAAGADRQAPARR